MPPGLGLEKISKLSNLNISLIFWDTIFIFCMWFPSLTAKLPFHSPCHLHSQLPAHLSAHLPACPPTKPPACQPACTNACSPYCPPACPLACHLPAHLVACQLTNQSPCLHLHFWGFKSIKIRLEPPEIKILDKQNDRMNEWMNDRRFTN